MLSFFQSGEGWTLLAFCLSYGLAGLMGRFFKAQGLIVFMSMAVLVGNLQVFKASPFLFFEHPVALGTSVFVSLGIITDLLTELYGPSLARQGVWLSAFSFLGMTLLMGTAVASPPVSPLEGGGYFWSFHKHVEALFQPMPLLFCASMAAYISSELVDIKVFSWLKKKEGRGGIWRRVFLSTAVSGFVDNTVFSLLAWVVFAAKPLPLDVVFQTYIMGTYGLRLFLTLVSVPCFYGLKSFIVSGRSRGVL